MIWLSSLFVYVTLYNIRILSEWKHEISHKGYLQTDSSTLFFLSSNQEIE